MIISTMKLKLLVSGLVRIICVQKHWCKFSVIQDWANLSRREQDFVSYFTAGKIRDAFTAAFYLSTFCLFVEEY